MGQGPVLPSALTLNRISACCETTNGTYNARSVYRSCTPICTEVVVPKWSAPCTEMVMYRTGPTPSFLAITRQRYARFSQNQTVITVDCYKVQMLKIQKFTFPADRDNRHLENRYIAIFRWNWDPVWWNFVCCSRLWLQYIELGLKKPEFWS